MFRVGDRVILNIVDRWHTSSMCKGRDGETVEVVKVSDYIEPGDLLYRLIRLENGELAGTHIMNLLAARACPMEASYAQL